ncbi:TPA: hypothetical protein N0F65_001941 [Lagenidium giganteum]|uniref:Ubiquitin carboxyl-terminal hydrolase n=1 Tax=Lagenidium giganteum TaxID=4803 RepID=A0AAV2YWL8_9STRA|nr:TPA: hypothetical protein N0F65_001941 [Lagenidium giganteum]
MCVEEVQALKAEVQRALLSLGGGGDGTSYDNCDFLSGNDAGQRYGYTGNIGMSLPAQTLLAELAAASRKRRQAETDLLRDMQRDEYERQYQHASYLKLCKSIASLRAMRQEIQRDMASTDENEWVPSGAATPLQERPDGSDTFTALLTPPVPVTVRQQPVPRGNNVDASSTAQLDSLGQSNQQYSIEGFITRLEPTGEKQVQRPVSSSSKSGNWLRSQDTLTDVFQLQLKFAETMLRLEESVQMRDRLLQQKPLRSSHPRVRRRLESKASRRNPIYAVEDSEELSDSEDYLQSSSDEYVRQRRFRDTSTTAQTTPTERDGVFTALIEDIGVKGVQVEELYSLDEDQFAQLSPVYGLVFLFKWEPTHGEDSQNVTYAHDDGLFFAKQVINNACATQAILSILMNCPDIELGETLSEFKAFTGDFPSDLKGLAISNSDKIRLAHNSFSRAEPFVMDERKATGDDDVYHFVAYVPVNGKVYELDGLREGPICLGEIPGGANRDGWLKVACPVIQKRIEKYSASEIRFNLLALVSNRIQVYQQQIAELMEQEQTPEVAQMLQQLQSAIAGEEQKRKDWALENMRRKHNYIPFIVQLLKLLAEKKQLEPLIKQQQQNAAQGQGAGNAANP